MISINVNPAASGAGLNLGKANDALQKSLSRLSSGRRIVNSSDDAGGLAVSMKMAAAQKRTEATAINLRNVVSYLDTQDGAFKVADKVLSRMSELSTLARDVTKNGGDVENYNKEFENLKAQLTSLSTEKFNGQRLFSDVSSGERIDVPTSEDGSQLSYISRAPIAADPMMDMMINGFQSFEIGGKKYVAPLLPELNFVSPASITAYEIPGGVGSPVILSDSVSPYYTSPGPYTHTISVTVPSGSSAQSNSSTISSTQDNYAHYDYTAGGGITNGALNYSNSEEYAYLSQEALQQVADMRAQNGAEMSRINFAQDLLDNNAVNLEAANSRIMDVDVAAESSQLARFQILQQAGTAMLAQANTSQQSLVRLLQG
jgi:flagellin-like hook-associated protein FlgL